MATVQDLPAMPATLYRRPSSIGSADIYGSYPTSVPTTVTDGSVGGARVEAAISDVQGATPAEPDFLRSPVAVLLVLVGALAVISFAEP